MLADTGLVVVQDRNTGAFSVRKETAAESKNAVRVVEKIVRPEKILKRDESGLLKLDTFTVTGTQIRGGQPTSPLVTIRDTEMRMSGHNDLGEVIRALPQNFSGGQNPGVQSGAPSSVTGSQANQNFSGGSSLNLRGLGPDATLVLLNGARLPYDGFTQATDITVIPTSAINRIEIVLDGASAIYGSDAIGGVANVILKRDYNGAEISARIGSATDGGFNNQQFNATTGTTWKSGGLIIAGEIYNVGQVKSNQRKYLPTTLGDTTLYPSSKQRGILFSGHQRIGADIEFTLDGFYTSRKHSQTVDDRTNHMINFVRSESEIFGISPSLRLSLPMDWSLCLQGSWGSNKIDWDLDVLADDATKLLDQPTRYENRASSASVQSEGPVFHLPGGDARLSVGGGWREGTFQSFDLTTSTANVSGEDRSYYNYAEINLPVVGEKQKIALVRKLIFNGAIRHEEYRSFGGTTTPKIGALWSILAGIDIKASWGRSFKVPTLNEQFQVPTISLARPIARGNPPGSAGTAVLELRGGNRDLHPARAEVLTVGFVARPENIPGLDIEVNSFTIDYTDRVRFPIAPITQALTNPAFSSFVKLNPSNSEIASAFSAVGRAAALPGYATSASFSSPPVDALLTAYNSGLVYALVDNRQANVAKQYMNGIDASLRYRMNAFNGKLVLSATGSWIIESTRKLTAMAAEQEAAGTAFFPANFKGRIGATWSQGGLTLSTNANLISGVTDTTVAPTKRTDSMLTIDAICNFATHSELFGDLEVNVAATNLLNRHPPLFGAHPLGLSDWANYDSTNYSALGRLVSVAVIKKF
ncbi:MAG: TonB-dependent receptor [Candidatus Didemnitutus sp.]|nr:TonB-dependent receptor [Candidatus Didemnitutus sp.]